jgi:trbC/VIRB2 family
MAGNGANSEELKQKTGNVLGIVQVIGSVVSVIILMAIGIKYMLGSVEEKAEYKKTLMPYLIGAALVFSGTTIPQILYQISKNI